ncbi:Uu.00g006580.m01.CDS01 [Anthostomella pinea]|uniref:Uu.00g006580.m01.CDS01 n=1 Tax=Anthostomella pinea TaxID=933095 RepID=A0AAI8YJ49_9PEZI|nr:Uu.00g006580.m01.CDS01 [Anthostomella pinea]
MSDPTYNAKSASFLDWFKAWPGATFHPHIKIEDLRAQGAGRGIGKAWHARDSIPMTWCPLINRVVTTADIPEDTVLFTIPRLAIINTQTSDLAKRIPGIFATTGLEDADNEADEDGSETSGPPDNWVSLILVMVYEYLQGDKSHWRPYFDVLPDKFETLMWWSDQELQQLQASSIVAKIGRDDADSMFRAKVLPLVREHASVFYPQGSEQLSDDQLMLLSHRMGSMIMAYAFDLENDDDDEANAENGEEWVEDKEGQILMGMVPMADILNADAEFNAHVNHGEDSLTVTSLRPIPAGEQVVNYYGPLGNGELLRRYGYVTHRHTRYDVVELSWNLILSVLRELLEVDDATWGKAINELDPEEVEDAFIVDRDLEEPDSRGEVHDPPAFKHLPEDLREQIHMFLKAVRKARAELIPDKRKRDEVTLSAMRRALELRLAAYGTSAADDMKLISGNEISGRHKMAVVVRHGEKVLLQEAINLANEKISQLALAGQDGHQHSAKRQRTK